MIDSSFIITYTNALYSTPESVKPSYNEFRDMFSWGQLASKEWAVRSLESLTKESKVNVKSILIAGSWYGTLGLLLNKFFCDTTINLLDIDGRCQKFLESAFYQHPNLKPITGDMFKYSYQEDLIINTSCEHIENLDRWIELLPKDSLILLQSNNAYNIQGHVNCVNSIEEFTFKSKLTDILYTGQIKMPMYTRFMIIGKR